MIGFRLISSLTSSGESECESVRAYVCACVCLCVCLCVLMCLPVCVLHEMYNNRNLTTAASTFSSSPSPTFSSPPCPTIVPHHLPPGERPSADTARGGPGKPSTYWQNDYVFSLQQSSSNNSSNSRNSSSYSTTPATNSSAAGGEGVYAQEVSGQEVVVQGDVVGYQV